METPMRDLLDLDRYPIDRLDSPEGVQFAERCKSDLAVQGTITMASPDC
jgi:hypothetical protein